MFLKYFFTQQYFNRGKTFLGKKFGFGHYTIELPNGLYMHANFADRSQRNFTLAMKNHGVTIHGYVREDWYNIAYMQHHLPKNGVMFDIGGNIGTYALHASQVLGGDGQVHYFDPNKKNVALFEKNIQLNNAVDITHINTIGLLDVPGEHTFEVAKFGASGCGRFIKNVIKKKEGNDVQTMVTDTLDNYVKRKGVQRIDFIKLDVEGAEILVLKGGKNTLETIRPKMILLEFGHIFEDSVANGHTAKDLFDLLTTYGYVASYFAPIQKMLRKEDIDQVIEMSPGKHLNVLFEYKG